MRIIFFSSGVKASVEEQRAARIPLAWRDTCVDLLLPLNQCRDKSYYLPWKCTHERHTYEKCLYDEFALLRGGDGGGDYHVDD